MFISRFKRTTILILREFQISFFFSDESKLEETKSNRDTTQIIEKNRNVELDKSTNATELNIGNDFEV